MEQGTGKPEHNVPEVSKASDNLAQNLNCEPLAPENHNLDSERVVVESVEKNKARRAQSTEMELVSMDESSSGTKEMGPSAVDISQNLSAEKGELLENVKILPVPENMRVQFQNGPIDIENMDLPPGFSYPSPSNGSLKPADDVTNNSDQLEGENKGTHVQARTRKSKSKTPVSSSWVLRPPKSNEKPKSPEISDTANEGSANGRKERRGRKKKQIKENTVNEFPRTKTHLRYLLHRIKYEQNLIDAYSAEGWKGQSLEKLKPEKELQHAKSQILRYKLKIRELFQHLDSSLAMGKLSSLFDSKGEIDSEDIFCAKCGSKDLPLDNDIILCDGACERGFHQFCLEPPLLKEDIPPGDEGWFCPGCSCKADCIDMLKDVHGTNISIIDTWEKIFPEAAAAASGKKVDDTPASSSDDSEDDDYDPDKPDKAEKAEGDKSCSKESNYFSVSGDSAASHDNNETCIALPPDDSEDDSFDPTSADPNEQEEQGSSSSDFTSDSEDLGALLADATEPGEDQEHTSLLLGQNQPPAIHEQENSEVGRVRKGSLKNELSILMETFEEPVSGKRRVERLDYQKLHNETYGDTSSDSSDEDFDESADSKRRKTNKAEEMSSDKIPFEKSEIGTKAESHKECPHLPKGTRKKINSGGGTKESVTTAGSVAAGPKKSVHKRIGEAAKQRLYESFNENQYPERSVKENLANELGLTFQQVDKWFGNARWSFNHKPQNTSNITEKPPEPSTEIQK